MHEAIVGEIVLLPPCLYSYPNHTPQMQFYLTHNARPVILGRGKPKDGDIVLVNSKRANFAIVTYNSENPCPSPRKILATWDQISDRHLRMIKNGTLRGRVSLERLGDKPELNEKGQVTFLKTVTRRI